MVENTIIGIRSYFTGQNADELEMQLRGARKYFPESKIVVALCGDEPTKAIKGYATKIFHYSKKPVGWTQPWKILTDYAKSSKATELIVVDGDGQHIFSEIRRIYDKNRGKVVVPEREKRIIFLSDSEISRVTLEDLENTFLRVKYNCTLKDPQPGLFMILNRNVIYKINFNNIDPWIGDAAFLAHLYENKVKIASPKIKVRSQTTTSLNLDIVFKGIIELEKYFGISFLDIINAMKKRPEQYLYQGRLTELDYIKKKYGEFQNKTKIKSMKGLILSGGHGTRLRPITHTKQKQLIPIANRPILFYVIDDLAKSGITEIGIITGPNKDQIQNIVGDGSKWNVKITYMEQQSPLGLAHAVKISRDFIRDDDFIMYLGDNLLNDNITEFVSNFQNSNADASILLNPVKDPSNFGVATLNKKGEIVRLVEKPKNPSSNLAVVGVYAFRKSIFKAIDHLKPSARGELEITDAIQWLVEHSYKVTSELVEGWWKDTGKADSLLEANHLILDGKLEVLNKGTIEDGAIVSGRVNIGDGTVIKKGASIRGPVIIGQNCFIGPNVFIGPFTSIGNNVQVLSGEIEYSILLADCKINTNHKIIDSLIGENCVISSEGTAPMNRGNKLVIGDNSNIKL
ncbi:MAG TPA: glucose-1-phosphate thymidylyltransferase [Candidatus Nanoarchaeia archaeon]|nr:glucose-1-phosphate thymidylyltransferase [Candidatus Nanoarchaeia archaeon]